MRLRSGNISHKGCGQDDPEEAVAAQLGEVYMIPVPERDDLGADGTRRPGPGGHADDHGNQHGIRHLQQGDAYEAEDSYNQRVQQLAVDKAAEHIICKGKIF